MDGVGGLDGWRWIFILEGLLTVLVSILAFFLVTDSPETAKFLTKQERAWLIKRLSEQYVVHSTEPERFRWKYVLDAARDWQVYLAIISKSIRCQWWR